MQVKVVLRADVSGATYDKVAVISGLKHKYFRIFELLPQLEMGHHLIEVHIVVYLIVSSWEKHNCYG